MCSVAFAQLFVTLWIVGHQTSLVSYGMSYGELKSMGFSRQEYWSWLPFSSPGDLPDPGVEPETLVSPVSASRSFSIASRPFTNAMKILT